MHLYLHPRTLAAAAAAAVLAACGGGGGGDSPAPPAAAGPTAEGAWSGTLTGSQSTAFQLLVLEDGSYWSLYGTPVGATFLVRGFIQGQGTSSNGTFTSTNARDYGVVPPAAGNVSATYTANATIQGSVAGAGGTVNFTGTPIPDTSYDYDAAASLSAIAGSWLLNGLDNANFNVTIAANGTYTGVAGGCSVNGAFTPRPSGKNVYNVSVSFGPAPCARPNTSASGIAVHYALAGGGHQLIVAGTTADRAAGTALFGARGE
jgi:hypothetical protein